MKMFAVYDQKVGSYMQPFAMRSKGEAVRGFMNIIADPKTEFHRHPSDFHLFELGEWDELSGAFKNHQAPVSCGMALEYHPDTAGNGVSHGKASQPVSMS